MKGPGSFKRGPKEYARRPPRHLPSGKTFLVVTEGERTEPNYLKALRNRLQLSAVDVKIVHPEGTDPVTLVREAVRLRDEQSARAKQSSSTVAYDEVWVVFDLEQTHDERRKLANQAMTTEEARALKFAVSDPCFEYWLLLHSEYTSAVFKDCLAGIRRLKTHWKNYAKGDVPPDELFEKLPQAVVHATRRRKLGGQAHPFTDMDLLVTNLNAATRPHYQFDFSAPRPRKA